MSILLGAEIAGDAVRLVGVDRRASDVTRREEPLVSAAGHWWETHPEERHRALVEGIADAVRAGQFRPADVAGLGIVADPSLVLLDPDFVPIPPRELPWGDLDPVAYLGRPWDALTDLIEGTPSLAHRIGMVLDLVGFLRFRLTGSLGVSIDFAWSGGLVLSPEEPARWSAGALESRGLSVAQVPPIFPAVQRVSVVGEETITKTGLRRGTWVVGGGNPLNTRLLFAGEPLPGHAVVRLLPDGIERWDVGEAPEEWSADVLPTARDGVFFHRRAEPGPDPRAAGTPAEEGIVVDWDSGPEPDLESFPPDLPIAADAGRATAGSAIIAGLGLGWWRDPRPLWRKRRPARPREPWRAARAAEAVNEDPEATESE